MVLEMSKDETKSSFGDALSKQFKSKWIMLIDALSKCPEESFHDGIGDWSFSYTIYHIIETAEFYIRNSPDGMKWGSRAGFDWNNDSKETISKMKKKLAKELLLEYLEEIQNRINQFLKEKTDKDLLKQDDFHWFDSIYEKLVYLLRHNSFHIGELAKTLREWETDRIKWV
jgi:uncharacterized damage-inducible protein DinB